MGVYVKAKKQKDVVNFSRAEPKPLEMEIYVLNRKMADGASENHILEYF